MRDVGCIVFLFFIVIIEGLYSISRTRLRVNCTADANSRRNPEMLLVERV